MKMSSLRKHLPFPREARYSAINSWGLSLGLKWVMAITEEGCESDLGILLRNIPDSESPKDKPDGLCGCEPPLIWGEAGETTEELRVQVHCTTYVCADGDSTHSSSPAVGVSPSLPRLAPNRPLLLLLSMPYFSFFFGFVFNFKNKDDKSSSWLHTHFKKKNQTIRKYMKSKFCIHCYLSRALCCCPLGVAVMAWVSVHLTRHGCPTQRKAVTP